ncbi:DUF7241 domain-containing protein [Marinobacter shengliensis]|uniref:DUF7241 domain-containing protein n=1 Tax=Marinobacter shengliensis TaxID=1389223 RepID=UPI001107FD95|nr:hypothetical protein [Marinobacter shengliensis]
MERGNTEVETLKLNGWGLGDILEGDEGYGPDQIKIIAMGNERFICQWRNRETGVFDRESPNTTLSCREWRKVGSDAEMAIDWHSVAGSAIEDMAELTDLLGVPDEEAHRPITALVREYIASHGIEDGWEVLPEDLRTHLNDFKEAISQVIALGDQDGYWKHQLQTLERVGLMLIDRDLRLKETGRGPAPALQRTDINSVQ